jgi:hypothetical protein
MRSTSALVPDAPVTVAVGRLGEAVAAVALLADAGAWEVLSGAKLLDAAARLTALADQVRGVAVDAVREVRDGQVVREAGFSSTARWLEVRAGMSPSSARAAVETGERLQWEFPATREAWLAGEISADAAREITTAVPRVLRALPVGRYVAERDRLEAVALRVARSGTVTQLRRIIGRSALVADPTGAEAAVLAAREAEFLRFTPTLQGVDVRGFLSAGSAALVLTAFDQRADTLHRTGTLSREDRDGLDAPTPGLRAQRREHLNARILTDLVAHLLGEGQVGTRHAQRPHVTVTVHADDHAAGLGGELLLPGFGPVPVPSSSIDRILCDADVHPVRTAPAGIPPRPGASSPAARGAPRDGTDREPPDPGTPDTDTPPGTDGPVDTDDELIAMVVDDLDDDESWIRRILGQDGRHVLDVGRSFRSAPPKLRRALAVRDQHCAFPGCRVDPSRCEAHHVQHWEHRGATALSNLVLLCTRHHHLVHEGRWTIETAPDLDPGHPRHFSFVAPVTQP